MLVKHHPLAKTYKHCGDYYAEQKIKYEALNLEMPRFHMVLLYKRKVINKKLTESIHNTRLLLPAPIGMKQIAQVYLFIICISVLDTVVNFPDYTY